MNNNILIFVNIGRSSISLDHTQKWVDIHQHVSQNTMPAIDRVIGNRIVYNQTELKYVLQQLHRHRRETWKILQDSVKAKNDKKRKGTNSRRSDVSNLIVKIYHITIMLIKLFHFKRKRKGENEVLHICIIPMMIF